MRQQYSQDYKKEELLTQALRNGIEEAFAYLFETSFAELVHYAAGLIHDKEEAMDIVQTVFVRLYEGRGHLAMQSSMRSYLLTAVYHQCLNQLRHRRVMASYMETGEYAIYLQEVMRTPDEATMVHGKDVSRLIRAAVRSLPHRCREVYMLKYAEGLHNKEVAARLGISTKTVEAQTTKALSHLRSELSWLAGA